VKKASGDDPPGITEPNLHALENKSHPKLNLPLGGRRGGGRAERGIPDRPVRGPKGGLVQKVEKLGTELQRLRLGNPCALDNGEVDI
jgi:hypothetical protein